MLLRRAVVMLLCLMPLLVGCTAKPWVVHNVTGLSQQIHRQGETVADIHIGALQLSGAKQAQQVEQQLTLLWQHRLEQHTAYAEQLLDDMEFNGSPLPGQLYYTVEESPAAFFNDGKQLSVVVEGYEHVQGAAHPLIYRYAYNFDAATGQQLSLNDIWGADAREHAAAAIYAQVESEGRQDDFYPGLAENLLFTMGEYGWYMDDKNIYIIYNPYDIAPYALGIIEFTLPR